MSLLQSRRPQHGDVTQMPSTPRQQAVVVLTFFFPIVSLVIFSLRAYGRLKARQWGIVISLGHDGPDLHVYVEHRTECNSARAWADDASDIKLSYVGWHEVDVPRPYDPSPGLWWFYVAQMIYNPILALVKASVLVFLLRLGGQKKSVRWSIHGLNIFNALHAISVFFVALLQCIPIEANWDLEAKAHAKCVEKEFHVTASILTIITDFLVLGIPFWIFLGLKMPKGTKLALIAVFMVGLVVIVVALIRLVEICKIYYAPGGATDFFYSITIVYSTIEVNLAIISASVPALRYLVRSWLPHLFGSSAKGKYETSGQTYYGQASRTGARTTDHIGLKDIRSSRHHTEIRSDSPTGSEEEIMAYNGIIRTMDVHQSYSQASATANSRDSASFNMKQPVTTQSTSL
ncbi:cfem domain-containing [Fusarium albosuccineum]|uniref:Cfem domain-containing n=1 Tax=Fusarium albosuccineum TaxID=1237068 RepID=A0A8H4P8X7_9HYPO|nr:cfem domain-containing [Fusarium albosuccineum]